MTRSIALFVLAAAVLLAPAVWHLGAWLRGPGEDVARLEAELAGLEREHDALARRHDELRARVDGLDARTAEGLRREPEPGPVTGPSETDTLKERFAQVVQIANRRNVNDGLTVPSSAYLREVFGEPHEEIGEECTHVTNDMLSELLILADVGPFKVKMLRPAVDSLRQVMKNVQVYEPELYARIRSSGSLCVRRVRGSEEALSSHAFGLAVDLNVDGQLDTLGDGKTQLGLILLADFFHQEGWIWGAGFGREDSMHFEVSREMIETWRRLGQI